MGNERKNPLYLAADKYYSIQMFRRALRALEIYSALQYILLNGTLWVFFSKCFFTVFVFFLRQSDA